MKTWKIVHHFQSWCITHVKYFAIFRKKCCVLAVFQFVCFASIARVFHGRSKANANCNFSNRHHYYQMNECKKFHLLKVYHCVTCNVWYIVVRTRPLCNGIIKCLYTPASPILMSSNNFSSTTFHQIKQKIPYEKAAHRKLTTHQQQQSTDNENGHFARKLQNMNTMTGSNTIEVYTICVYKLNISHS